MADHIGETGTDRTEVHGRDGSRIVEREYRVIENANHADMLRIEYVGATADPTHPDYLGARGWISAADHDA